jgi:hypothetical protein
MNSSGERISEDPEKITLYSKNGFTAGKLLYEFAQFLGDYDDAEDKYGNHAHFEGLIIVNDGSYNIDC